MHEDRAVLIVNDVCDPLHSLIEESGEVFGRCVQNFKPFVIEILREGWFHATHRL